MNFGHRLVFYLKLSKVNKWKKNKFDFKKGKLTLKVDHITPPPTNLFSAVLLSVIHIFQPLKPLKDEVNTIDYHCPCQGWNIWGRK